MDRRARGQERVSAKVQIGAELLCKGAKVETALKGRPETGEAALKGGSIGRPDD